MIKCKACEKTIKISHLDNYSEQNEYLEKCGWGFDGEGYWVCDTCSGNNSLPSGEYIIVWDEKDLESSSCYITPFPQNVIEELAREGKDINRIDVYEIGKRLKVKIKSFEFVEDN